VKTTKPDTCVGPLDVTPPIEMGTRHPVENIYAPPTGEAQWVKRESSPLSLS
jgi:hypothetical protein